jgi:Methyltransferase domain
MSLQRVSLPDLSAVTPDENELAQIFVHSSYLSCQHGFEGKRDLAKVELEVAHSTRLLAQSLGAKFNSRFARECVREMNSLDLTHDSVYRAFDAMDEVFGVDYTVDDGMLENQTERLYEGGGVGVQTSYSSLLTTLQALSLPSKATMVDLGSGFGRIGFTLGCLRPDVQFVGYEYVDHRVQMSKDVAMKMGLTNVQFFTQDLSDRDFKIPVADVYYMFDPFNRETYAYVLDQLIEIGKSKSITIVTKGRANVWASDALKIAGWLTNDAMDLGAIQLFRSPNF